jgi:hypothetical protein
MDTGETHGNAVEVAGRENYELGITHYEIAGEIVAKLIFAFTISPAIS